MKMLKENIPVFQGLHKIDGADNNKLAEKLSQYFVKNNIPWKPSPTAFSGQIYFIPNESLTPITADGRYLYDVSLVSIDDSPFVGIQTDLDNKDSEIYKTLINLGYEHKEMTIPRAGLALPVKKFGDVLPQLEKLAEILYKN